MKKYIERKNCVLAMRWDGFISMPELVEMNGGAVNILLRHDESVVIFDNGYDLKPNIIANKGSYIVLDNGCYSVFSDEKSFNKKYVEYTEE